MARIMARENSHDIGNPTRDLVVAWCLNQLCQYLVGSGSNSNIHKILVMERFVEQDTYLCWGVSALIIYSDICNFLGFFWTSFLCSCQSAMPQQTSSTRSSRTRKSCKIDYSSSSSHVCPHI